MSSSATIDFQSYTQLLLERDGYVLNVTLNLPDKMNPVSGLMTQELIRVLHEATDDSETRVIVLTGAGKAFSAGGDISVMKQSLDNPSSFIDAVPETKALVHALLDCPKPVIGKVNGHAIGLGATVALFCDIVFAAEDAKIADAHIVLGLVPGDGGAIIWPALIGLQKAKRYLMTGDRISGKEAAEIGLINEAVPLAELDATVTAFARRLADGPPRVLQFTKMAMNAPLKREVSASMDAGLAYEVVSAYTEDHREALMAWLEKRKPNYIGK